MKSFRELTVWQRSVDFTVEVYRVTSTFPSGERFGLTSQMRRAAVSIASNIAEGSGRHSRRDFRHFVLIGRGSAHELQTQLVIAQRLGLGLREELVQTEQECIEIGRMLQGLADFLQRRTQEESAARSEMQYRLPK